MSKARRGTGSLSACAHDIVPTYLGRYSQNIKVHALPSIALTTALVHRRSFHEITRRMWILEASDDILQGKKLWLRPGRKYLFGRVKRDGVRFAIDHKTVSRKHFIIDVDNVGDGDVSRIHVRTKLTITDQESKAGTYIDGELIKGSSRVLQNAENSVRPGNAAELTIKWQPCVLTYNLQKKEIKSGVLQTKRDRVQSWGVKAISEFVPESTTHLVVKKRNTPKGLQALIMGKFLVAESYIDAIEYATTPANLDQEENVSPLEIDFDNAWPNPKDHLPPPGREPTARGDETYEPNSARSNIFENFVFVFGDQTQYDNLLPVITTGSGKAMLFKATEGTTTVDELVHYIRDLAGKRGFGYSQDKRKGGAVLVRWHKDDEHADYVNSLVNDTALKLDQRAIDQAEFLDAILANDAYLLRQSVPYESTKEGRMAPPPSAASFATIPQPSQRQTNGTTRSQKEANVVTSQAVSSINESPASPTPAPAPASQAAGSSMPRPTHNDTQRRTAITEDPNPRPLKRARFAPKKRFEDFDDDFDVDSVPAYTEEQTQPSTDSQTAEQASPAQVLDANSTIKEEPSSTSRKRAGSPSASELRATYDEEMDELLPGAAAMKRMKLAKEAEARTNGRTASPPLNTGALKTISKPQKKEKNIDVRGITRAQREAQDEAARLEEESLEGDPGFDLSQHKGPANLVVVETFELPSREKKPQRVHGEQSDRWDPKWNGRKNFKKFRRQGQAGDARRMGSKVIVPLVEWKGAKSGIGEEYWERTEEERERDKNKEKRKKAGQSQRTQSQRDTAGEDEDQSDGVVDDEQEETSPRVSRLQKEVADIVDHAINLDTPRRTRGDDKGESQITTQTITQARTGTQASKGGTKRPAAATSTAVRKKQKTLPVTTVHGTDSEEDDSDDMKFKFGRGRGGRARGRGRGR